MPKKMGEQVTFTSARTRHNNSDDIKLEISSNPTDPKTWYLLIHGK
jgi:hypothetical protein